MAPVDRYTKALDCIKTLRKERVAELKADKERLKSLELEKARADKVRRVIHFSVLFCTLIDRIY